MSGLKWIASYPDNVDQGFPRASAVLILNDWHTGYPFACLESSVISAARTAASAVWAARLLHPDRAITSLGIVGAGLISRYVLEFFKRTGWQIPELAIFDTHVERAEVFRRHAAESHSHQRVTRAEHLSELVRASEIVLFATTAGTPYVSDRSWFEHHPTVLHLSLRDLSPELLLESQNLVDDVDHVMNANTSAHLAEQMSGSRAFVNGTLAALALNEVQLDRSKTTIVSPFGLGVLDLALGKWIYDTASARGNAVSIPDFFFDA